MKHSIKKNLLLSLLIIILAPSSGWTIERSKQKQFLRDLCTLNIFMSGQQGNSKLSGTVIDNLLDKNNNLYPERSQLRYSYLDTIEVLGNIYSGNQYLKEFTKIFSELTSTQDISYSNISLCTFNQIATPSWVSYNIINPTYSKIFPLIERKFGVITGKLNDSVSNKTENALKNYLEMSYERNKLLIFNLSNKATNLMNDYLNNGISYRDNDFIPFNPNLNETDIEKLIQRLREVKSKSKNPLYWNIDYFSGITFPTTIKYWRLHTSPISRIEKLYMEALNNIEDGTFQLWWNDYF